MSEATASAQSARFVVIYDGECPFCRKQVARIKLHDKAGVFDYTPRQEPGLEQRYPTLAEGDFNTGMRLIHPSGSIDVGADAVYQIARRLSLWKHLAWLYRVPVLHQAARAIYGAIAKYRYKLARRCDTGVCETS
jgi:predicted DCC family thiol-disulfide oxidoreductase YuxK